MSRLIFSLKKIIPEKILNKLRPSYHLLWNFFSALRYNFPAQKLLVIGVTGTTGKTTTILMLAKIFQTAGFKVGYTSTTLFSDGDREWLNDKKMTMLGRSLTQKMLAKMLTNGCQVAIVETTSEGITQNRHRFINYDICLLTDLYPEHIESHGSFANYKQAKLELFQHLTKSKRKKLKLNKLLSGRIPKTIIVNLDNKHAPEFLQFQVEQKFAFKKESSSSATKMTNIPTGTKIITYRLLENNEKGSAFLVNAQEKFHLNILGEHNVINAVAALTVAKSLQISSAKIRSALAAIKNLPGRLEKIEGGQNFTVIVDYAFEPKALRKLYQSVSHLKPQKIIHVLGSAGGGRDTARRPKLGKIAGALADYVIVTNEDPYDDNPQEIIKQVAGGASAKNKILNRNLFLIEDRRQAIKKALSLAQKGDLILITGKGAEQAIAGPKGELIPWDDRQIVKELLQNTIKK